ncbi:MAG: RNA 2',3'-cyclic phosphodiesterase [Methylicorpusculum sp.]|nr:RNA 2',3'-cyclic phosphodiesterase [Methylicorpusculum sp.]
MKRLFFALWPDESVREQCTGLINKLDSSSMKTVIAGNLHVTLCFLGSVNSDCEMALMAAASDIVMAPVSLTFDQLSFWKAPKVLCLTSSQSDSGASSLADEISALARSLWIRLDERPYLPHVTLARGVKDKVEIGFDPIVWVSHSFCLVQSCSTESGVEYRVLKCWPAHTDFSRLSLA